MKIALLQIHSSNNRDLYELTIRNHIKYCETHKYDMIQINSEYSKFLDFELINSYLNIYDVIFTIGSDVIFTNFNIPLTKYIELDNPYSLYIDINGNDDFVITNFDFCIWVKNENTQKLFDCIKQIQLDIPNLKTKDDFMFGTQSIIDFIIRSNHESLKFIKLLQPRCLQSLPPIFESNDINRNNFWSDGDLSIHFFTGDNKWKYDKCYDFMKTHNLL